MRIELKLGLLLNTLAIVINRFAFLPDGLSAFLCGAFLALGLFFLAVNFLPENKYNNLFYRKWIASKAR